MDRPPRMKFQATTPDGTQGASRKIPNDYARRHTKRHAKWRDADKARNTLMQAAQNESTERRAKLAVRAKQTSGGTYAKYRMPRRIQNDAQYDKPTHKTARQIFCIRADNADKIRPSCLACRARRSCIGYSARNPESKL
ncbi:hypothetical protein [uncultured Campylobacter sp.]|uniref:hypothetical protein n=1 Tax=uncultured Campylobacter sp. TaxID=218934 RepID=UPI0026388D50|nr:hypothetical protein [uncultured Campylobacter sp.]